MELPPISSEENLAEISKFRKQSSCCAEQAQCHIYVEQFGPLGQVWCDPPAWAAYDQVTCW